MDVSGNSLKINENRKRKTHTKSRKGCKNCKLRRVKCDETRPQCQKCLSFGVTCNYNNDSVAEELHLPGEGALVFSTRPFTHGPGIGPDVAPKDSLSPEGYQSGDDQIEKMLGMAIDLHRTGERTGGGEEEDEGIYRLGKEDLEILRMFRERTVFTIGTAQSVRTYQAELVNLCFSSSCLTHAVITLTLMHNRYITSPEQWSTQPTEKESFHWYHATAIFNTLLSNLPIKEADKDAIWGTSALLGAITIASIDATKPEEAWPMAPDTVSDLDWLRMSDGKKEVWRLTDPLRETSVWKDVMNYNSAKDPEPYGHSVPELDMLAPFLIKLYAFDPFSTDPEASQDPYHTAASILVRLLELDCNHHNIMYFLSFLGHMDVRFRQLLHAKDPKALLLLAWWYGKMCQYNVWWQSRRMVLEGQAICIYLERFHADEEGVVKLLDYPKMMTGLVGR